jgi:glycosyltransferase involved in cell wall biosynthesis
MNSTATVPVSVVVPCFRCSSTVQRAVRSVAAQTRLPFELILVDDGSGDDTVLLLRKLAALYPPGWIKIELLDRNVGAAGARNAGWARATQPYVAFLDADDAWHPEKIQLQYEYMSTHLEVALSGHGHRILKQNILPDWAAELGTARQVSKWQLLLSNQFVTPSVMVRRDVKSRFVESQRHMEDHMLWLEIIFSGGRVMSIDAELAAIYKNPFGVKGLSSQIWMMERAELENYRRLRGAGFITVSEVAILSVYSTLKFIRRLAIYGGYLRWKK